MDSLSFWISKKKETSFFVYFIEKIQQSNHYKTVYIFERINKVSALKC